jgi:hypothetical protein
MPHICNITGEERPRFAPVDAIRIAARFPVKFCQRAIATST